MFARKINGIIQLFRLELSLAAGICVTAGQVLASGSMPSFTIWLLGFLCAFMLSSSALILNDYFDFEVDRINAPDRALPSGAVKPSEAIGLAVLTALTGLASAFALGLDVLLLSIVIWIIGVLYNWRYKQTGLAGNLMVSVSVAITFILGAMTVNRPWDGAVWTFSLIAFFIDLGEEIAGDAMDMEGDRQRASHSIALLKGRSFALRLSVTFWSIVILLSLLPVVMGWLGTSYFIFILITDGLIILFSIRLLRSADPASGRRAMRGVYLGATVALIAFLIGQFFG